MAKTLLLMKFRKHWLESITSIGLPCFMVVNGKTLPFRPKADIFFLIADYQQK